MVSSPFNTKTHSPPHTMVCPQQGERVGGWGVSLFSVWLAPDVNQKEMLTTTVVSAVNKKVAQNGKGFCFMSQEEEKLEFKPPFVLIWMPDALGSLEVYGSGWSVFYVAVALKATCPARLYWAFPRLPVGRGPGGGPCETGAQKTPAASSASVIPSPPEEHPTWA